MNISAADWCQRLESATRELFKGDKSLSLKRCARELQKCAAAFRRIGDKEHHALSLFRLGQARGMTGELDKARRFLFTARRAFIAMRNPAMAVKTAAEEGVILRRMGRLSDAERIMRACVASPDLSPENAAGLRMNLANLLMEEGKFREAFDRIDEAREAFEVAGNKEGIASVELSAGNARYSLGLYKEARDHYGASLAAAHGMKNDFLAARAVENLALNDIAQARSGTSANRGAIRNLMRAEAVYRRLGSDLDLCRVLCNLARVFRERQDQFSAVKHAHSACALASRIGSRVDAARAGIELAWSLWATGDHAAARNVRRKLDVERNLPPLLRMELLLLQAAFDRLSSARRSALRKLMTLLDTDERIVLRSAMPWLDGERESIIARALEIAISAGEVRLATELMTQAQRRACVAAPAVDATSRVRSSSLAPVRTGRRNADDKTLLLDYHLSQGRLFIRASREDEVLFRIQNAEACRRLLGKFREEIAIYESNPALMERAGRIEELRGIIRRMRQELIDPVSTIVDLQAGDVDRRATVHIRATGPLMVAPFTEMLRMRQPGMSPPDVMFQVDTGKSVMSRSPRGNHEVKFKRAVIFIGDTSGLTRVDEEIASMRARIRSSVISGARATRKKLMEALTRYDLIYFIGHAVTREVAPPLSYLKLSSGHHLFARDIASLRLRRRPTVFLSACSGADEGGGIGLASSLLAAGAREVVASLWRVVDETAGAHACRILDAMTGQDPDVENDEGAHIFLHLPFVRMAAP